MTPLPPRVSPDGAGPTVTLGLDTYTVRLGGADTGGRYAVIDMFVPPGGGPPPHAHAFEEGFWVLEGRILVRCGTEHLHAGPGDAVAVPPNVPHHFVNDGAAPARLVCVVAPAGLEEFFALTGAPAPGRTTAAPPGTAAEEADRHRLAEALAARYGVTFLPPDYFDRHPTRPREG